jgi:hypothetical protein
MKLKKNQLKKTKNHPGQPGLTYQTRDISHEAWII